LTKSHASYVATARLYARQVTAGEIPACHWVQRACQRQLDDLSRFKGRSRAIESIALSGRCNHAFDVEADNPMTLVLLAFTSHLYMLSVTGSDWKYVSPCTALSARIGMERYDVPGPMPKKSRKCSREEHVQKLMSVLMDP